MTGLIRSMGVQILLLSLIFSASLHLTRTALSSEWIRADSIVATIDGSPVLESEILMEMDLGLLKSPQEKAVFGDLLQVYLNRMLILKEVEEVGGFRLTAGQAESAYQGYILRYENRQDYEDKLRMWGIDEEEVLERLSRALLVSLYTESRIQFFVNILPSDIEKAYAEERERWGETTVYEAWETIKSELLQRTYIRERDRWLSSLRDRYHLIIYKRNGDYGE